MLVGGGSVRQLGALLSQLGVSRPLIVSDSFLASSQSGAVNSVVSALDKFPLEVFTDTISDPTTDSVERCRLAIQRGSFDSIVAVGGGSPMDTAKAAAVLYTHKGHMRDYKAPFLMDKPSLPLIAIPTTAGTGSEVTRFTIVTDSQSGEKMLCIGLAYLPFAAVLDYELTLSMPWRLTADTGIDALCHAMEARVSKKRNTFSDSLALSSLSKISKHLRKACYEPHNHIAREAMMLASTEAGMAFSNSSVTLIHGMSRPIGALFHVPHGLSNAMLAPKVTAFSLPGAVAEYAECARAMNMTPTGADDAQAAAVLPGALASLCMELKVPSMAEFGIPHSEFEKAIPMMAQAALASGSPNNNPIIPTQGQIEQLYRECWAS
jgi:alcohol dehydrogenase class IV